VLLAHDSGSGWSYPAFYTLASGSFGLQIGLQQSELVLIVLTERGMHAFMEDEFKIGAQAGLAIVTLGSSAQAATTSHVGADIVVWASSSGLYGGLTLEGTIIKPRYTYDEAYYGRPESANDILYKRSVTNPNADGLRQALDGLN
jgi:lipid-binding SYLF domain-containing protein